MNALRWTAHALLLALVAAFCWASGDLAPAFGWACGIAAGSMEEQYKAWRRSERS